MGHANIAITSGHLIGRGPGNSKERDLLPQAYSDFIFAIILEELGLIPGVLIIFLYLILLIRTAKIANKCDKDFPAFMVMGIALLIATQALINMMVAVGLFPVSGATAPTHQPRRHVDFHQLRLHRHHPECEPLQQPPGREAKSHC